MADIEYTAGEIQIAAPCILAQLDRIGERLVANDRTPLERYAGAQISGGDFVVRAPSRVWASDIGQSVSTTDVLRRLEPELERHLAPFYSQVVDQREGNDRVRSGVNQLDTLSVLVPEGEAERFRFLIQIEQMRGEVALMDVRSGQLRDGLAAAKMLLNERDLAESLGESGTLKFCRDNRLRLGKLRPAIAANAN